MPNYAQAAIQLRQKKERAEKEKMERESQVAKKLKKKGHIKPANIANKEIPPFPQFSPYIGPYSGQQAYYWQVNLGSCIINLNCL